MKFHGIQMVGSFQLEKVTSLPSWTPADESRMIYNTTEKKLYIGTSDSWSEAGGGGGYGLPVTNFSDNGILDSGKMYFIDTSTGSMSGNLISNPLIGDTVTIVDTIGTFDSYSFTVKGNGNNIQHDINLELDVKDVIIILVWTGTSWKIDVGGVVTGGESTFIAEYSTDFIASNSMIAFVDTRANEITVTLPDENTLSNGVQVTIFDQYSTFNTNKVTVLSTQAVFENGTNTIYLINDGSRTTFTWDSGLSKWKTEVSNNVSGLGNVSNIDSDYDANVGDFLFINTTNSTVNITLPPSDQLTSQSVISIYDQMGTFDINPVNVIPTYGTINGKVSWSATYSNKRIDFIWDKENTNWKLDIGGITIPEWILKTSNFNCIKDNKYIVDTTSADIIATLPATPTNGDTIKFIDGGDFSINFLTIATNGNTIKGIAEDMIVNTKDISFELVYYNNDWKVYSGGMTINLNGSLSKWEFKTSNFNCIKDNKYMVDTTNHDLIATLPATPTNGDTIKFIDGGDFSINFLTIATNGNTIKGIAEDMIVNTKNISFELVYYNNDWKVYNGGDFSFGNITWTFKTSNFNCIKDNKYMVDTTNYDLTAILPVEAINGDTIKFADGGDFSTHSLTVARNGNTIEGLSEDMIINTKNISFELVFYNNNWKVYNSNGGSLSNTITWELKTSNFNCIKDNKYMVDTTNHDLIATLPAIATNGDTIKFAEGRDFSIYSLTIARNGHTIEGLSEDMIINTKNISFELVFYNNDWKVV